MDIAQTKLMNVGASDKDGITERDFRGIGRLGGLAYAEKVKFVTSAIGDHARTIMTCDCIRMQQLLQKSNNETTDIMETFKAISTFEEQPEKNDKHYFEVCLLGVPEESGLLDEEEVIRYLAETAPVDFDSQPFLQARKIRDHFSEKGFPITCYKILRGARKKPMEFTSHTVAELKQIPCPEQFREILPYYLIEYNGKKDQMGDGAIQLSLMDDSDIVIDDF